ncbi:triple QxxK/R motif-containing protein isoform X1 [Malaclemys terrapin pileata]|uniref:triple QxxK/R motif-containing protein isoform X1 n=2 Tax=Malaclemys terrapin pileata TaxID=2991368 RepID=UPI0023A8CE68|nr:triple QxxK/R motif-containing protein isoform X1 [Malaclemys terrapin pileata]
MRGWVPQGDTGARTSRLALRLGRGRWSPPPPGCPRRRRWDCPGLCAERLGSPVAAVGGPTPRSPPSGGRRRRSSPAQPRRRTWFVPTWSPQRDNTAPVVLDSKRMGRKDASAARIPVEQYRKQIGKQDYKKSRPVLRATRLKAEAKKTALGINEVALVLAAILVFLLAFYAFFYLNLSSEVDLDLDPNEN